MTVSRDLLSLPLRLYIYGLHGFFTEIVFTAVWDFVVKPDYRLHGCTSIWSLFIYAIGVVVNERLFLRMRGSVPAAARGLVYLAWTYAWEYSTGLALDVLGARPWDYTELTYNVHGLIALEYAPLWYCASLVSERLLIRQVLSLGWEAANGPPAQRHAVGQQQSNGWPGTKLAHGTNGAKLAHGTNGAKLAHGGNGGKLVHGGNGAKLAHIGKGGKLAHGGNGGGASKAAQNSARRRNGHAANAKPCAKSH